MKISTGSYRVGKIVNLIAPPPAGQGGASQHESHFHRQHKIIVQIRKEKTDGEKRKGDGRKNELKSVTLNIIY